MSNPKRTRKEIREVIKKIKKKSNNKQKHNHNFHPTKKRWTLSKT